MTEADWALDLTGTLAAALPDHRRQRGRPSPGATRVGISNMPPAVAVFLAFVLACLGLWLVYLIYA